VNYHVDYESFSLADLPKVGAYRYAEDPDAEILMVAVSAFEDEVLLWVPEEYRPYLTHESEKAEEMFARIEADPDALVWAHNAQFERAVTMFVDGPLSFMRNRPRDWRCTAALCRKAAIPDSLDKASKYLQLDDKKDSRGKALIRKFCVLQTAGKRKGSRLFPSEDPQAFEEFGQYCRQDVRTEKAIHVMLKPFELRGAALQTFLFDIELNDIGLPVNRVALVNAQKIVEEVEQDLATQFTAITGLGHGQKQAVKGWLHAKGLDLDNMQGDTIEAERARVETLELDGEGKQAAHALNLYDDLNYAATKKITTMLASSNNDCRVRGTLMYHGALTGRWSGRGVQPQNFKKPSIENTDMAYRMIEQGYSRDDLELLFGNPLEAVSSTIRHFIDAGEPIFDADYAGIEARIVCWLAGQDDALDRFRQGVDSYKVMAGMIYNVGQHLIDSQMRQLGKTVILGAGFQMGAPKFLDTCHQWGLTFVTKELAVKAVNMFRALYDKVVKLWGLTDKAARRAVAQPNMWHNAGDHLAFKTCLVGGRLYLLQKLPSQRVIAYAEPRIEADPEWGDSVTYYGQLPGKVIWGRIKMYGGKWVENATQAVAADVMAHGAINARREGYIIFTLIHDQALAFRKAGQTITEFCKHLTDLPMWATGLPLVAEGKVVPYYLK
jgi:DNA polymerase bacteriophage-type